MSDPGNAAQVRVVAEQLFEIWKSEQAKEGVKQRASWPAWLGVVLAVGGIVFSAGGRSSDMAAANTRIEKLEHRADGLEREKAQILDRLARIETKLDVVLEQRKAGGR